MVVTERLYHSQPHLERFTARVVSIDPDAEGPSVVLDRTAFFPAGGGQPADRGTVEGIQVLDVQIHGGYVYHYLQRPLQARQGDEVTAEIDGHRRRDHTRQHSAQHLLSAVLVRLAEAETVSFHLGETHSTVDLSVGRIEDDLLLQAEDTVNDLVLKNLPVSTTEEPDHPAPEGKGPLRVVTIGDDFDVSECCGTHVRRTGEIGPVRIIEQTRVRGRARLSFVAGERMIRRARCMDHLVDELCELFGSRPGDVPGLAAAAVQERAEGHRRLTAALKRCAQLEAEKLLREAPQTREGMRLIVEEFDDNRLPTADYPHLVSRALPDAPPWLAVLATVGGDPVKIIVIRSEGCSLDLRPLRDEVLLPLGGSGGGSPDRIQGIVPADAFERARDAVIAFAEGQGHPD